MMFSKKIATFAIIWTSVPFRGRVTNGEPPNKEPLRGIKT